jgi:hypothetical protein
VVRYFLREKQANFHLANVEFANSATRIIMLLKSRAYGQDKMIKLLLKNGGPLEEIDDDVSKVVEET